MKVKATKKGFDGETLREEGDVFYFEAFAVKEDGTNNLGSWMESMEDLPKPKKKPVIDEPEITSE